MLEITSERRGMAKKYPRRSSFRFKYSNLVEDALQGSGGGGRGGERRVKGWSKNASETKTSRFLKVSGSIGLQTGAAIIIIHFPGRVPICIWHAGKNNALNAPLLWSARPSTPSPGSQSIAKKITQLSLLTLSFKRFHAFFFPVGISFTQFHKRVPILLGFLGFYSDWLDVAGFF